MFKYRNMNISLIYQTKTKEIFFNKLNSITTKLIKK